MIVEEREYARLLGYPWGTVLKGDVRSRAEEAAAWYDLHGKVRVYCVTPEPMDGPLAAAGRYAGASVAAITAGAEVDREVDNLWVSGRVDEAYFLDRYAAALVEAIAAGLGPCRSPGTGNIPFEEQWTLFSFIQPLQPEIQMLPSGMLTPRNSLLAFVPFDSRRTGNPCVRCHLAGCTFRRKSA